jgi:predicted hotdog family 3-hydroxylacyl-ACP dehydratase
VNPTDEIRGLIPHGDAMSLLERIVSWNESSATLATTTHRSAANVLRRHGRLHAIHLCEYGAQAMAVHGGLVARAAGRAVVPGLLVSLRDVVLSAVHVESLDGELLVDVECLQSGAAGVQYAFRVTHRGAELARGRAAVIATAAAVPAASRDPGRG